MAAPKKKYIASVLRKRIEHALDNGALTSGDRLPSTREIGEELGVDPRIVLSAYGLLAEEGLVVLRPRSGVFVGTVTELPGVERTPPADLLIDVLVGGVVRGISLKRYVDALSVAAFGGKIRVAVVAATEDQAEGLCRELRSDYGLSATPVLATDLARLKSPPAAITRAHILLTTAGFRDQVQQLADGLAKTLVVASVRPSLIGEDWRRVLRSGKVYVVACDAQFFDTVLEYIGPTIDVQNVKLLIVGQDDIGAIPPNAPTYVTTAARRRMGSTRIPGRLIPPARLLAEDTVRAIVTLIVTTNLSDTPR